MIYGLIFAGAVVVLLVFFALKERLGGGERKPVTDTGDGGVTVSNASMYDSDTSSHGPAVDECVAADDAGDCASDGGGSDGGGGDGGGGGGGD